MNNSDHSQLTMTLEFLRMATLSAVPPTQGSILADPTPVLFTLAKGGASQAAKPLSDTISAGNITVVSESTASELSSPETRVKIMKREDVKNWEPKQECGMDVTSLDSTEAKVSVSDKKSNVRRSDLSFRMLSVPNSTGMSVFSTRCDVVYKKILRDFRRVFIQEFN